MRAALIAESGFQDEEFVYPFYRMREEGWSVRVATPDGNDRLGKYGVPARATTTIKALGEDLPDVLVIPGGFECPDRLRGREDVQRLLLEMSKDHRLIAAICHGPWVLISAGLAFGARMTGYESIVPDILNAGADYRDEVVVVDERRRLVTARHYRDNGPFMKAVIAEANSTAWGPELCGAAGALT